MYGGGLEVNNGAFGSVAFQKSLPPAKYRFSAQPRYDQTPKERRGVGIGPAGVKVLAAQDSDSVRVDMLRDAARVMVSVLPGRVVANVAGAEQFCVTSERTVCVEAAGQLWLKTG